MATEIKVPTLGESVTTATVARWLKKAGESVAADEPLVELETDKVTVEVNAPGAGTLGAISAEEGAEVEVGAVLATLDAAGAPAAPAPKSPATTGAPPPGPRRAPPRPPPPRPRPRGGRPPRPRPPPLPIPAPA